MDWRVPKLVSTMNNLTNETLREWLGQGNALCRSCICAVVLGLTTMVLAVGPTASRDMERPAGAKLAPIDDMQVGFRLHFGKPHIAGLDIVADGMDALSVVTNAGVVIATWKGHPMLGSAAEVTARFTSVPTGWEYALSWKDFVFPMEVESVSFPDVIMPHTEKAGILHARAHGMGVIRRPDWKEAGWRKTQVVDASPKQFRFIALLDESAMSRYIDARDGGCFAKRVYAFGAGIGFARLGFTYVLPVGMENSRSFELPWKGLIAHFRGGWFEAAEIYRPWARRQDWYHRALAKKGSDQFNRLRDIAFWAWNRGTSTNVIPPILRFAAETGLPTALDWYWWHTPGYDTGYPDYWPPREGEEAFCAAIASLRAKGIYSMVYTNGMCWDRNGESWHLGGDGESMWNHAYERNGCTYNVYEPGHYLVRMCSEAPIFQNLILKEINKLALMGLDAVYMDMISCSSNGSCWNPQHRHAPGGGDYLVKGYQDFVARVRRENPNLALSSEECSEDFLGFFDSFISLFGPSGERCGVGVLPEYEMVPVWNALYHGLTAVFGTYSLLDGIPPWDPKWPAERRWKTEKDWMSLFPDQFAVEFARTVAWGNQPTAHNFILAHATDARFAADYAFMKATAAFYHANRMFLFDGDMRAPGRLACRTKKVDFLRRSIYSPDGEYKTATQEALPVVFHNVWRAPDGRTAAVLVNWDTAPAEYDLRTPDVTEKGVLPPRSWKIVNGNL